jgi:D-alanyl-D-alanine carboxypeptidase
LIATVVSKRADKMTGIKKLIAISLLVSLPFCGFAAPSAAIVIDAKSGKVLHSENANTRLHPAGLTKLATLYIALAAIEAGEKCNQQILRRLQLKASKGSNIIDTNHKWA